MKRRDFFEKTLFGALVAGSKPASLMSKVKVKTDSLTIVTSGNPRLPSIMHIDIAHPLTGCRGWYAKSNGDVSDWIVLGQERTTKNLVIERVTDQFNLREIIKIDNEQGFIEMKSNYGT